MAAALIREVPDYPKPGVLFKDLTPLFADPAQFEAVIAALTEACAAVEADVVVGIEARGFIVASPVALRLRAGFVPVRKPGKLPATVESQSYELEYGSDLLEIHRDAVAPGQRVLVVDDVLATGGTAAATARLVERLGGTLVGYGFVLELVGLGGRSRLGGGPVTALLQDG